LPTRPIYRLGSKDLFFLLYDLAFLEDVKPIIMGSTLEPLLVVQTTSYTKNFQTIPYIL